MADFKSTWISTMYNGRVLGTSSVVFDSDGIFMTIAYSGGSIHKAGSRVGFGLKCTRNADTCYGLATLHGQNFGVVIPLDYESKQAKYITVGPADYGTINVDKAVIENIIKMVPDTDAKIPIEFERMQEIIRKQGSSCLIL